MPLNQTYYIDNLSIKSADPNIVSRNDGGNLVEVTDEFLYIEPVTYQYINSNINNVLTTNFSYYKFPSRILVVDEVDVDSITLDELNISDELSQPIKSRYKLNKQVVPKLLSDTEISARIKDGSIDGNRSEFIGNSITTNSSVNVSMQELQFDTILEGTPQLTTNRFTVTEDVLNSGKDIRFKVKVSLRYTTDNRNNNYIARVIRINPDTSLPTVLEEQTSAPLVTPNYLTRNLFIQKEISEDSIYISKNSISRIQTSYDQTKQQLDTEMELQDEKIINYVNGAIGSSVLSKTNTTNWDVIVSERIQGLDPVKSYEILTTYKNLIQDRENQRNSKLNILNQQTQQLRELNSKLQNERNILQLVNNDINQQFDNYSLLTGRYGYLSATNTPYLIEFDLVVQKEDLKLNDTYAVEFVNGPIDISQGGSEPIFNDDQSYWLIEEISDASLLEIEKDIEIKRNKLR